MIGTVAGTDEEGKARSGAQAVERALSILDCFSQEADSLSITEISRRTGLNVSTAYRIARALCARHYLEQDPATEGYRLGPTMAVLGQRALRSTGFAVVQPLLEKLARDTGESASFGLRRQGQVEVLLTSVSSQPLHFGHPTGGLIDPHASAMGKVLLAFTGTDPGQIVDSLPALEKYTDATITTKAAFVQELARVREAGVGLNDGERYEGVSGIAAPVLDATGVAVAAVGIQGPSQRLTSERLTAMTPVLLDAASAVSAILGLRT